MVNLLYIVSPVLLNFSLKYSSLLDQLDHAKDAIIAAQKEVTKKTVVKKTEEVVNTQKEVTKKTEEVVEKSAELLASEKSRLDSEKMLVLKNEEIDRMKGRRNLRGLLGK